jgi:hypothetical protein|tara:strand:+ start:526 stop:744 length:219 start_codon:yes stop_codon:yes gene_type:complete
MIFEDPSKFISEIENYVKENGGPYMDAVLEIAEQNNIEPEAAAKFLTKPIIEKIRIEGESINMLPKGARLPI